MNQKDILKNVDHTLLNQTATWEEIRQILDDAIAYETASACIPASYVKQAAEYVKGRLAICTVIGFPNGYSTSSVKIYEAKDAIINGADEIDMVIKKKSRCAKSSQTPEQNISKPPQDSLLREQLQKMSGS